ncbi:MAG: transposase [Maricaulis sp.]|jgi:transposase|nr:transposase [Maricaulis sp.]
MTRQDGSRRRHGADFKREIVAKSYDDGVSVAALARRFELNANMVFLWRRDERFNVRLQGGTCFLPVQIGPPVCETPADTGPDLTSSCPTPGQIKIALVCGTQLSVGTDVDEGALVRVVRAIGSAV